MLDGMESIFNWFWNFPKDSQNILRHVIIVSSKAFKCNRQVKINTQENSFMVTIETQVNEIGYWSENCRHIQGLKEVV